ncbi:LysR family transcriptional regulator [Nocardia sp. SYP-A9097]|uniref:LysR substrate-binding domain-containing protein n=1 Tax=Nocardia sp. SYP-A9097 TaxID=2663237 RepID=UPI00129B51BE|nr:LysR substrate-binding domain-containing protein [Nocardia sp. SYP-A9097]MRH89847.1 LysR family transcriptional regulator [Nocardia sp. SYP-A9097]
MERIEIEAFLTLADELHFGKSADRMRVSTGRVSQLIHGIERRFGAPLFERTSRRVVLTPVGKQLLDDLRPGHDLIQEAIRRATAAGRCVPGTLEVGFVGTGAGTFVLEAADRFTAAHPGADVRIRELPLFEGSAALHADLVEMVLTFHPVNGPGLRSGPVLRTLPRLLALPKAHALAARDSLSLNDLADITLIGAPESTPKAVAEDRVPNRTPDGRVIRHGKSASTFQEAISLVGGGEGAFVVGDEGSCYRSHPRITYLPIEDAPPLQGRLIWRESRENARIRAFNEAAIAASGSDCRGPRSGDSVGAR